MPINAFWEMNAQIGRISAEFDLRGLTVANASQSSESAIKTRENLIIEMGEPVRMNPLALLDTERDEEGIQELKSLGNLF